MHFSTSLSRDSGKSAYAPAPYTKLSAQAVRAMSRHTVTSRIVSCRGCIIYPLSELLDQLPDFDFFWTHEVQEDWCALLNWQEIPGCLQPLKTGGIA